MRRFHEHSGVAGTVNAPAGVFPSGTPITLASYGDRRASHMKPSEKSGERERAWAFAVEPLRVKIAGTSPDEHIAKMW